MKLNATSQYAIRVMAYIAKNGNNNLCTAKIIAEVLTIPYKYLTKIMSELVEADILISIRGRDGGYKLANAPSEIKIIDILKVLEESFNNYHTDCFLGTGECDPENKCALHDQWVEPKKSILAMFKDTTLADIS
jgi:Rrf2 family protein